MFFPVLTIILGSLASMVTSDDAKKCSCSPLSYQWVLNFTQTCSPSSVISQIQVGNGTGISDAFCTVKSEGANTLVTDFRPVLVTSYQIIELDSDLAPIKVEAENNIALKDGNKISFESITTDFSDEISGGLQAHVNAINKENQTIELSWIIRYSNICGVLPFSPGDFLGWMTFLPDEFVPPRLGTCFTDAPSTRPSDRPTFLPTMWPSAVPSETPTEPPTTKDISESPTDLPSEAQTRRPSKIPTQTPTSTPIVIETDLPSASPTFGPSKTPTDLPLKKASEVPTALSTASEAPSAKHSYIPTNPPSLRPRTTRPSVLPTGPLSGEPSFDLTTMPSSIPTMIEIELPSIYPTMLSMSYEYNNPINGIKSNHNFGPATDFGRNVVRTKGYDKGSSKGYAKGSSGQSAIRTKCSFNCNGKGNIRGVKGNQKRHSPDGSDIIHMRGKRIIARSWTKNKDGQS